MAVVSDACRVVSHAVCGRKRKHQFAFIVCVLVFLLLFSSIQYMMTAVLLNQWPPTSINHERGRRVAMAPRSQYEPEMDGRQRHRRTLGVAMPTIDYERFKKLEERRASSDDPDVIRLAREAMLGPGELPRGKVKIRSVKRTGQAEAVEQALHNKTGGFFVECGAFDGETSSNTVYLEHFRKWTGLLVEMDPWFYTQLVGKRRNAWSINACLSNNNRIAEMKFFESDGQLGRLDAKSPAVSSSDDNNANSRQQRKRVNTALCFPLESLLFALNRTHVDYFSLDVEGFELDILRTIPFERLDISVVSAEFLHSREPASAYDQLMTGYGYRRFRQIGDMDLVFVKEDVLLQQQKQEDVAVDVPQRVGRRGGGGQQLTAAAAGRHQRFDDDAAAVKVRRRDDDRAENARGKDRKQHQKPQQQERRANADHNDADDDRRDNVAAVRRRESANDIMVEKDDNRNDDDGGGDKNDGDNRRNDIANKFIIYDTDS